MVRESTPKVLDMSGLCAWIGQHAGELAMSQDDALVVGTKIETL